ncbi:MAG TPA: S8 family serine peptidase [Desulfobaccales bacterium]
MKRVLFLVVLLVLGVAAVAMAAEVRGFDGPPPIPPKVSGYVPGKIVVKFDPATLAAVNRFPEKESGRLGIPALDQLGEHHGVFAVDPQFPGARKRTYKGRVIDLAGWHIVRFKGKGDVQQVAAAYKAQPGVVDAQPVSWHSIYKWPNDQFFSPEFNTQGVEQWHLKKIKAPEAWDFATGNSQIIVAVLDTGVKYYHKDLGGLDAGYNSWGPTDISGNIWLNQVEISGSSGSDADNNGYNYDWLGYDFVHVDGTHQIPEPYEVMAGEDYYNPDNDPRDYNGHGTHCAGNVAAITNNSEACASVAGGWGDTTLARQANGVRVMALRVGYSAAIWGIKYPGFENGFVEMDWAAQALRYAADNGARIASCSWGSGPDGGLPEAVDYFLASGGLIFKAAGNDGTETNSPTYDYLCSRADVIKVAATDENDQMASFSNYGAWVDICAPGVSIWSLWVDEVNYPGQEDLVYNLDGTSMAAPLAASVGALIWSQNPDWTTAQVKEKLFNSADNIDSLNPSYAGKMGYGRVNAFKAVSDGTPPPAPEVGVDSLEVGKYVGTRKNKTFTATQQFIQGDTVVFRAHVKDGSGLNVVGANVEITITGPANPAPRSCVSNSQGVAETSWSTSAPNKRGMGGTATGQYQATVTKVTASGYVWDNGKTANTFTLGQK